ncbi:cytochrome-c peroxidase [Tenacibaculum piscium]|uniref:cytochrome-c peroxidase n=1 Tax=Tenacibaculum piscium TaxID=1458515 RepID=UPI001F3183C1|nr:cytochrome c peroxidase [Tenacibaculum piscium]MCG8183358.1 cytochrome-c peroxidase [Tenacibaculum piscium]MCG8204458.1 cytochrome-c peroxidase [Tenacibaculum piscium]
MKNYFFVLVVFVSLFSACSEKENVYTKMPVAFEKPSNFPEPTYDFQRNPLTDKGIALGKKIFYDGVLSSDGTTSCASCHEQTFAFTHHGHQFSHGVDGREGTRNTPPIQNMAFQKHFAWDGATSHLDMFPIVPITNPNEMDETVSNVIEKLKKKAPYKKMYEEAFDNGEITSENTFKALSQFMLTMVSANSKYDTYIRNETDSNFSSEEKKGLKIFQQKCATCHQTDLFTDDSFRNNGLSIDPKIQDVGRMETAFDSKEKYKFKVPSLRNIQVTAPYMHDGRFLTLEAVLNFYSDGVQNTENLDPILKHNGILGIPLTTQEKQAIIVFLKTLTDDTFLTDKRFEP